MSKPLVTHRPAARVGRIAAAALLASTPALSHAGAQVGRVPVQPPQGRELQQVDQMSRARIQSIMQSAARTARVVIQPGTFVYASRNDVLLVNAAIVGADSVNTASFGRGVNLMFVYLQTPPQSQLPPGFYTVRITGRPGAVRAALVAADGRVAADVPATLTEPSTARKWWHGTASVWGDGCTVDWHGPRLDAEVTIHWEA